MVGDTLGCAVGDTDGEVVGVARVGDLVGLTVGGKEGNLVGDVDGK